jgi:hypothetical protein
MIILHLLHLSRCGYEGMRNCFNFIIAYLAMILNHLFFKWKEAVDDPRLSAILARKAQPVVPIFASAVLRCNPVSLRPGHGCVSG